MGLIMPVFRISYTTPLHNHDKREDLEWVTESDWDSERTIQCFHERFPGARIVGFLEIDNIWRRP